MRVRLRFTASWIIKEGEGHPPEREAGKGRRELLRRNADETIAAADGNSCREAFGASQQRHHRALRPLSDTERTQRRAGSRARGAVGADHGEAGDILPLGVEGVAQLRLHRVQDLVDRLDVHA